MERGRYYKDSLLALRTDDAVVLLVIGAEIELVGSEDSSSITHTYKLAHTQLGRHSLTKMKALVL